MLAYLQACGKCTLTTSPSPRSRKEDGWARRSSRYSPENFERIRQKNTNVVFVQALWRWTIKKWTSITDYGTTICWPTSSIGKKTLYLPLCCPLIGKLIVKNSIELSGIFSRNNYFIIAHKLAISEWRSNTTVSSENFSLNDKTVNDNPLLLAYASRCDFIRTSSLSNRTRNICVKFYLMEDDRSKETQRKDNKKQGSLSEVTYVTRRLKRGNCTGRFCKLGRDKTLFRAEQEGEGLNGLTSTIFLCFQTFLECNSYVPFLLRRLFSCVILCIP